MTDDIWIYEQIAHLDHDPYIVGMFDRKRRHDRILSAWSFAMGLLLGSFWTGLLMWLFR